MNAILPPPLDTPQSASPLIQSSSDEHWRELIGQVGSDIAQSLSSALERVTILATTGKIDRAGLRALREEIEQARRVGMIGQQLARFASGRIRQSPEQITITQVVRDVLVQRGREATARGIEVRQALRPAEVIVDPTLLHTLVQSIMDWALEHAREQIEFRIDLKPWPAHARLFCQFLLKASGEAPADVVARHDATPGLDSMTWRLVQQICWTLGLVIDRVDTSETSSVLIEFPRTVQDKIEGVSVAEVEPDFGVSENSKPLAGSQVLVLAARRELRTEVRDAIRHMGLVLDFVSSVDEAEEYCRDTLPHAIIYESASAGQRFERLRSGLSHDFPNFVFIEIAEEGSRFALSGENGRRHAVIGRDTVLQSLPSALIYELSRNM